jgi:hypothetical protein
LHRVFNFVIDELVRVISEKGYWVSFPEGFWAFEGFCFFEAVDYAIVLFWDDSIEEHFVHGLDAGFDEFDGIAYCDH